MVATGRKRAGALNNPKQGNNGEMKPLQMGKTDGASDYEQIRDQRVKERELKMQELGLLNLSHKLKADLLPPKRPKQSPSNKKPSTLPPPGSPRRSSRLKSVDTVNYSEQFLKKGKSQQNKEIEIFIPEGKEPEVYTEEHEKLLGDCQETWTLCVDGYDEEGERMYDPVNGKTCHQCRQKTLGHHTHCSKCVGVQGQLCGDCLFTRYGENVLEANQNPSWICPGCRDICNCSRCRKVKGWMPTGNLFRKVSALGFKSVAHYLIQTRLLQTSMEDADKSLDEVTESESNSSRNDEMQEEE